MGLFVQEFRKAKGGGCHGNRPLLTDILDNGMHPLYSRFKKKTAALFSKAAANLREELLLYGGFFLLRPYNRKIFPSICLKK